MATSADEPSDALVEALPITQYLVMEVLAARWRTGEDHWTFPTRSSPAVRSLASLGLVHWKSGIVERTILVWMTDAGRALFLSDDWTPPAALVEHLGLVEETRGVLPAERGKARPPQLDRPQRRLVSRWENVP